MFDHRPVFLLRAACLAVLTAVLLSAGPALTTIEDVLYKADGSRLNGIAVIAWSTFEASDSSRIAKQSLTSKIVNGIVRVQLVPTTNATPSGYYHVIYNSEGKVQFEEDWAVPPSALVLRVRDVRIPSPQPGQVAAPVQVTDIAGLSADLSARPLKGPGYVASRAVIISPNGTLEAATGSPSDCVKVDGTAGPCGTGGGPGFVDNESPVGVVDGSNATFTLMATPVPASSLQVYRNGLIQKAGQHFTVSGRTLQFAAGSVPQPGDTLIAAYRLALPGPGAPPSIEALGDLKGSYPNPIVSRIQGVDVDALTPSDGQVLLFNGAVSKYRPTTLHFEAPLTFTGPLRRSTDTIDLPAASQAQSGYITSTDWNRFDGKVDGKPDLTTAGALAFVQATGRLGQLPDNLSWDSANQRLTLTGRSGASKATLTIDAKGISHQVTDGNAMPGYSDLAHTISRVYTSGKKATPNFSNEYGRLSTFTALSGQNDDSNSATGKRTFMADAIRAYYPAAGQKFGHTVEVNSYGNGDAFAYGGTVNVSGRCTSAGDECAAIFRGEINQATSAPVATLAASAVRSACSTTTAQAITKIVDSNAGATVQAVNVADATGCNVGDWVVIGQQANSPWVARLEEAVQITAKTATSISGVFLLNHASGVTVTPAAVLTAGGAGGFGQGRYVVNIDATAPVVNTGSISSAGGDPGLTYSGAGTNFSTSMVGGNAQNPGCIAAAADTYNNSLKSWFPIGVVSAANALTVMKSAGGRVTAFNNSAYEVRPCARILNFELDMNANPPAITKVILETNSFAWTSGQRVENAVGYDMNTYAMSLITRGFLPNATVGGLSLSNQGTVTAGSAFSISGAEGTNPNSEDYSSGINLNARMKTTGIGMPKKITSGVAISLATAGANPNDNKRIQWSDYTSGSYGESAIFTDPVTGNFSYQLGAEGASSYRFRWNRAASVFDIVGGLRFGPSTTNQVTFDPVAVTGSKTLIMPNVNGTLATLENNQTFGGTQTFGNVTVSGTCSGCGGTVPTLYGNNGATGVGPTSFSPTSTLDVYHALPSTRSSVVFTGSGLNNATAGGTYNGTTNSTFTIVVDSTGTPDTFKWKKDGGAYTSGVAMTGAAQTLTAGVTVTFATTTGHTLNDQWVITVTPGGTTLLSVKAGATQPAYETVLQVLSNSASSKFTVAANGELWTQGAVTAAAIKDATNAWYVDSNGNSLKSTYPIVWSSTATYSGGKDLGIARNGAGELEINDGTRGTNHRADLLVRSAKLNPDNTARPACDSTQRGRIWFTQGGPGVADTRDMCMKNADDTFSWRSF
jgi:hypothetical protein